MNNNEWITDQLPTSEDALNTYECVWHTNEDGHVVQRFWSNVQLGQPWMRLQIPEPYVKPKRYVAMYFDNYGTWGVKDTQSIEPGLPNRFKTREDAERIAAIYEEVLP